jgi:hypothetical protein
MPGYRADAIHRPPASDPAVAESSAPVTVPAKGLAARLGGIAASLVLCAVRTSLAAYRS